MGFSIRHTKEGPVRRQSGTGFDRELPGLQRLAINLKRTDAPGIRQHSRRQSRHQRLNITVMLLEMLRLKKKPFGPKYLAVP